MASSLEIFARRHAVESSGLQVDRLAGGISSEIYKVGAQDSAGKNLRPVTLTIYRDPDEWWKLEKEKLIRALVGEDPEVLLPELMDLGFDSLEGKKVGFIVSEFFPGSDLDTFIERQLHQDRKNKKFAELVYDIGYRIAALHKHQAGVYGTIGYWREQYASWQEFVLSRFQTESRLIYSLNPALQIGRVKSYDLQALLQSLGNLVGQYQSSLATRQQKISHGDARFGNFIADTDSQGQWKISSMIDLEAMLGGDPEFDVSCMENWLYFSDYREEFFARRDMFTAGYRNCRVPSSDYAQKRLIYHTVRSLEYLRTVFGFNIDEFIQADQRHVSYVAKHMHIVQSLARGNGLEDLRIQNLL